MPTLALDQMEPKASPPEADAVGLLPVPVGLLALDRRLGVLAPAAAEPDEGWDDGTETEVK